MYYFVYHINTIALSWQEKSTLLMNENKRIASPWIKIVKRVGAKALDEKCVETIQNQIMGVIFNTQNSQLEIWSLPTEKSFRYTAKIGLWQIFQLSIFVFSREKCHFQSDWIRNFRFLFSSSKYNIYIYIYVYMRWHEMTWLSVSCTCILLCGWNTNCWKLKVSYWSSAQIGMFWNSCLAVWNGKPATKMLKLVSEMYGKFETEKIEVFS